MAESSDFYMNNVMVVHVDSILSYMPQNSTRYRGILRYKVFCGTQVIGVFQTLPALCTNQAEMDFLMEALIMR